MPAVDHRRCRRSGGQSRISVFASSPLVSMVPRNSRWAGPMPVITAYVGPADLGEIGDLAEAAHPAGR